MLPAMLCKPKVYVACCSGLWQHREMRRMLRCCVHFRAISVTCCQTTHLQRRHDGIIIGGRLRQRGNGLLDMPHHPVELERVVCRQLQAGTIRSEMTIHKFTTTQTLTEISESR